MTFRRGFQEMRTRRGRHRSKNSREVGHSEVGHSEGHSDRLSPRLFVFVPVARELTPPDRPEKRLESGSTKGISIVWKETFEKLRIYC